MFTAAFKGITMETVQIDVFTFDELSETAKQRAREWFTNGHEPAWNDESLSSIKEFCGHFGVALTDYSMGAFSPINYRAQVENSNFKGRKLRDFDRNYMPTGYCVDCDLWMTFYDVFKATGDAKRAFDDALYAGFKAWRDDIEWQCSDEYAEENILANEYKFLENGTFWG